MSIEDKIKNAEETMWPLTIGMTTKKAIEHLLDIMDSMPDDACVDWRDSLAYAIDTMRKYQKIEQIYKDYCFPTKFVNTFDAMEMIEEVLKDGTNSD